MADIYDDIRQDHEDILRMLYELAERGGDPQKLFPDIYNRLFAHLGAEQDVLYEELLLAQPSRERALEGFVEHRLISSLLAELAPSNPYDERWHATLAVLRTTLDRHVADEEGPTFDLARRVLSDERAASLGGRYESARERHLKLATVR